MKNKFKLLVTLLTVLFVSSAFIACTPLSQIPVPDEDKISVQFVDHDGTVISSALYIEETEIVVPENPTRADSNGYSYAFNGWDKEVDPIANENVVYTATYTATPIVYNVTFKADGNQVGEVLNYTVENKNVTAPAVPEKAHYTGAWEAYELTTGNVVVEAVYTPVEYTITFMNGSELVEAVSYNVENASSKVAPAVPTKTGYTSAWGAYDFSLLTNQTVNVSYELVHYEVTFMADGVQVGEVLDYHVEMENFVEPAVPAKEHYTGAWEAYTLTTGNVTVNAVYTPVNYTISFMNGEELVGEVSFNIENQTGTAPVAPGKTGYNGYWDEADYSFTTLANQTVQVKFAPKTYTITYNANGGSVESATQEVTYASDYTLANPTPAKMYQEFLGWYNANDEQVVAGVWELDGNLTLTAKYSEGLSFETLTSLPSFMQTSSSVGSVSFTDTTATDGNKSLMLTASNSAPGFTVPVEFLADFFADPTVDAIAFDAKATINQENFRRFTWRSNNGGQYTNVPFDVEDTRFQSGVLTIWKTFYFLRSDYNYWLESNTTRQNFITSGGFASGDVIYVDNIRPVTANDFYGFESGSARLAVGGTDDGTVYYSTSVYLRDTNYANDWSLALTGGIVTAIEMNYTNFTQGFRALQFTKTAGSTTVYIPKTRKMLTDLSATNYMAIDVYVPAGSDATYLSNPLKQGAWNTVYLYSPLNNLTTAIENNFVITDTTGGTYIIDNIRGVSEEEYTQAALGFEMADRRLDTSGLTGAFNYHVGPDQKSNTITLRAKAESPTQITDAWFDSSIAHSGNYSLAFTKTNGYLYFYIRNSGASVSAYKSYLENGFTFWIYSTIGVNGTPDVRNIFAGVSDKTPLHNGQGLSLKANTWTQITIRPEDMTSDCRFLGIKGSTAGTFYFDDFQPLPAE